jgi:acetolactate synthase small subunit
MPRLFTVVLVVWLGIHAFSAFAQSEQVSAPVNIAGEQRMLTQRIVKLYSQIGLNILPVPAGAQLGAAKSRFETNLQTLKPLVSVSPQASKAFERLVDEWAAFRIVAAAPVSRDAALALSRQSDSTLAAADNLTRIIDEESNLVTNRLLNLAGRQRMLSQRIASQYLLLSWGVESSAVRESLETATSDFSAGLIKLAANKSNDDAIRQELDEVAQQWEWLQTSLSVEGASSYPLIVAESADSILEATDRITRLYENVRR